MNLLLLDEPTNHLDQESVDAFLEALDAFEGAVIIVTHVERVLSALATRLVVFDDGKVEAFEGGYGDFLDRVGWRAESGESFRAARSGSPRRTGATSGGGGPSSSPAGRRSWGACADAIGEVEAEIMLLEERVAEDDARRSSRRPSGTTAAPSARHRCPRRRRRAGGSRSSTTGWPRWGRSSRRRNGSSSPPDRR